MLAFEKGKAEEAVQYIKEHFVGIVADSYIPANTEEEADFAFSIAAANNTFFLGTAGGAKLNNGESLYVPVGLNANLDALKQAVAEFSQLPEAARKPKLSKPVKLVKNEARIPAPPPGGLIATYTIRFLERDAKGELSRAKTWVAQGCDGKEHALEPHTREMLWLTEKEWKSLVPSNPKKGDKFSLPESIKNRIFGYHADLAWPDGGDEGDLRGGELTLTVEEASDAGVSLRLDGYVQKGDFAAGQKFFANFNFETEGSCVPGRGYGGIDLRFLGFLHYDARKKAFDRFDVVALGDCWGAHSCAFRGGGVFGRYPIGFSFELNTGDRPADRIPPKCAPQYSGLGEYLKE